MTTDQIAAFYVKEGYAVDLESAKKMAEQLVTERKPPVKEAAPPPPPPPSQSKVARQPTGGSKGTTTRATRPAGTAPVVKEPEVRGTATAVALQDSKPPVAVPEVFLGPEKAPGAGWRPGMGDVKTAEAVTEESALSFGQYAARNPYRFSPRPAPGPPTGRPGDPGPPAAAVAAGAGKAASLARFVALGEQPPPAVPRLADFAPAPAGWQPGPGSEAAQADAARSELLREGVITPEMASQYGDAAVIRFYQDPATQKDLGRK
jgi:hypothetical protein